MKRLALLGLIATVLLVGTPTTFAAPLSGIFSDDDGNVHEPNIQAIATAGITLGCGEARYCPGRDVRRDEMATFLARALALPPLPTGPFTDIGGNIHAGSINAIAAAGITLGCGNSRFCPASVVRRDEMASFLDRSLDLPDGQLTFTDVGGGNPHAASIGAIAAAGVTLGCGPSLYCPADPVRRDEMASFLARGLGLEPQYVLLGLTRGIPYDCTKDRLVCTASIVVPRREAYEISEGFYQIRPMTPAEQTEFTSPNTEFRLSVDGFRTGLTVEEFDTGTATERRWVGTTVLSPGAHDVVAQWFWDGRLTQTRHLTIVVSG